MGAPEHFSRRSVRGLAVGAGALALVLGLAECSSTEVGHSSQAVVTSLCGYPVNTMPTGCSPVSCLGVCCSTGAGGSCDAPDATEYRTIVFGCPGKTGGTSCDGAHNGGVVLDDFTGGRAVTIAEYADAHPEYCTFQIDIGSSVEWTAALDFIIWERDQCESGPPACTIPPTPTASAQIILQAPENPPNHKQYTDIDLSRCQIAWDSPCGPVDPGAEEIICAASSEAPDARGSGQTGPDVVVVDRRTVQVTPERSGLGEGRCYTIYFRAADSAGNMGAGTCIIGVPKGDHPLACASEAYTTCDAGGPFCRDAVRPEGIDVSSATPDWSLLHNSPYGKKFAYAEVIGRWVTDQTFRKNWRSMRAAGIQRGAYYIFHANRAGAEQARDFLARVADAGGFQSGDLPPAVDVEDPDSTPLNPDDRPRVLGELHQMLEDLEASVRTTPVIYTRKTFWDVLGNPTGFERYPLWQAQYAQCPEPISTLPALRIWQYREHGYLPTASDSDLDKFNGTASELAAFKVP